MPGPIVLCTTPRMVNQPADACRNYDISKVTPYDGAFGARQDGSLTQVTLNNLEWKTPAARQPS
jgi:hypothetical protein